MFKILVSPYSRQLRNGKQNPKNYPYWEGLLSRLSEIPGVEITQIGVTGERHIKGAMYFHKNLSLKELKDLISACDLWIAVDNFFPHLCNLVGKPGVVIFGQSDPNIFGYSQNLNILKDKKYLREKQFDTWEAATLNLEVFNHPAQLVEAIRPLIQF